MGRAARNVNGKVLLFAKITKSMQEAMDTTNERRKLQMAYNKNTISRQLQSNAILKRV